MSKETIKKLKEEKRRRVCKRCGTRRALIRKYGINICRRCFKEIAERLGFEKYG